MLARHGGHVTKLGSFACLLALPLSAGAHDIWIESTPRVRVGGGVNLALMLGNHGNRHRDFKLASRVSDADRKLVVYGPIGTKYDLSSSLLTEGMEPGEGFWTGRFQPESPGLYMAASRFDKVMSYAPVRDIKSAKTFFEVLPAADQASIPLDGYRKPLGHALEIVPLNTPTMPYGLGAFTVQVLYKGKPLPRTKVSFIPRGVKLQGELDARFERLTDSLGKATIRLTDPNTYLVAAHLTDENAKGKGYESIHYSATLCLNLNL
ncbi:DUF4198 domain-containing protein [bacterium]|nr:MAG: DUF4198 domain-containing protein [bacterium]